MAETHKARNMGPKERNLGTIDASGDLPASCLVIFCMTRTPLETRVRPGWDTSTRDPCRLQLDVRITGCQGVTESGCQDIRMSRYQNDMISECQDVKMSECQNVRMLGCWDVRMSKVRINDVSQNVRLSEFLSVRLSGCDTSRQDLCR